MAINQTILPLTYNHLVFPPQLPGQQDGSLEEVEADILARLLAASRTIKTYVEGQALALWDGLEISLETCTRVNEDKHVNKIALMKALQELKSHRAIILHITEQNAGVLIRPDGNQVIFEAFQASPTAEETLAAKGAMQWDFPQISVSLPRAEFENHVFQGNLASFLEKASLESLDEFAAKTHKAGVTIVEARDTVDPALITHFLMTLLEVNGSRVHPPVLRKRVKDDVCWDDAELPWRRCPLWLVLRVSVQRLLYLTLGEEEGRVQYKCLICTLLSQLLKQCVYTLSPEQCSFLMAKLCRRLAKLESETALDSSPASPNCSILIRRIGSSCRSEILVARSALESQWNVFKASSQRKVPPLNQRARSQDLRLTLLNSGPYMRRVLLQPRVPGSARSPVNPEDLGSASRKPTTEFHSSLLTKYSALEELETHIESLPQAIPASTRKCIQKCQDMANEIRKYLNSLGDAYHGNSEQMSIFVLNIFSLWVTMDRYATKAHPLLNEYHPCFEPEILDVLLLWRRFDLDRLGTIQTYIRARCTSSKARMNIFADPQKGCFADEYFRSEENEHITRLCELEQRIDSACQKAREAKEKEIQSVNAEYNHRTEKMVEHTCTQRRLPDGGHDIRGCTHCWHVRCRRRLKIQVHEDFLPQGTNEKKSVQRRAALFELHIPAAFAAYRDATWEIINTLRPPAQPKPGDAPQMLLKDFPQLTHFSGSCERFSLASKTKSYLGTHYNFKKLPVKPETIFLPLGLTFSYFDSNRNIWAANLEQPLSLAHLMAFNLPKELPFESLYSSLGFAADADGPSSYETVASIPECPPDLTVHEYMSHQSLISGRHRRWFSILTELGASNINFSLKDTMILFHRLALQVGPASDKSPLREVHAVFSDASFCRTLLDQIERHVEAIRENWRENYYMETLLTLTIRVNILGSEATLARANALLLRIRHITLSWTKYLRNETRTTQEADITERAARYGFLSALLCRRTFSLQAYGDSHLDPESFKIFLEATLALQENLVIDIARLTSTTLHILVRDIKMAYRMREMTRNLIKQHPHSLESAIETVWPNPSNASRVYQPWCFLPKPNECWVTSKAGADETTRSQVIHYHTLEGHLLIDGKALGKLPAAVRDSEILKDLFANQQLVAFPSSLPGMSYMLGIPQNGYYIHLGYWEQELVIQAQQKQEILQLIPRHVFGDHSNFDLPDPLVRDCVHWLHLQTGILEARRKPKVWNSTPGNWQISIQTCHARRNNKSTLLDPRSKTFTLVAQIFENFAPPPMLTVYQPISLKGNLSVEIKAMDLRFEVNHKGLLQCRELASEIDPDQDAGTLYGLQSLIVMRDANNPSQRSIITTLGKLKYWRSGIHVNICLENSGNYARYSIDPVLHRLHCPPEPRLLYNKALLHAFTSFVLPDPLTGRTGTEETLRCLQSGACQPWTPLIPQLAAMLQTLANLTPRRRYYPDTLKRQQAVSWDIHLTTTIQHDGYQGVVESIMAKSQLLWPFHSNETVPDAEDVPWKVQHLRDRARWRRSIYERPESIATTQPPPPDDVRYIPPNRSATSKAIGNSREVLSLIRKRPSSVHTTRTLRGIMKQCPFIGGYASEFQPYSINDCLEVNLAHEWGGLVNMCRNCPKENGFDLMFQLGLVAFREDLDMRIMRTLASFFLLEDLRLLDMPQFTSVDGTHMDQPPSPEELARLVRPHCREYKKPPLTKKMRKKSEQERFLLLEGEMRQHEERCAEESEAFAEFLLEQWPRDYPSVEGSGQFFYLHRVEALDAVIPYWRIRYQAMQFSSHILQVQNVLTCHSTRVNLIEPAIGGSVDTLYGLHAKHTPVIPSLSYELLNSGGDGLAAAKAATPAFDRVKLWAKQTLSGAAESVLRLGTVNSTPETRELENIIRPFINSDCSVRSSYGRDLAESVEAYKKTSKATTSRTWVDMNLEDEVSQALAMVDRLHADIADRVAHKDPRASWLKLGGLWPSMSPTLILEQLRSQSNHMLQDEVKHQLIRYGMAIATTQYWLRVSDASLKGDERKLKQERDNPGHVNWDPSTYPDWLLLEIDSNIQIREDQVNVALEMISPSSGSNSVLQMNMGQGKTSVIMPMVACILANGLMLTRLMVPKALLSQTAQMLQSRLGGILGRQITHVPFSRRTPTTSQQIQQYQDLHAEMLTSRGIILTIPEHVLSFKLCGLQQVSDRKNREASQMVTIQSWMNRVCRDILDECDFTLATKTQLIYPSGAQLMVDGHPYRWRVTQTVLGLVSHHLRVVATELPGSVEVVERGISEFPIAYFLRSEAEEAVIQKLVDDICNSNALLPIKGRTPTEQHLIRRFISEEKVEQADVDTLSSLLSDVQHAWKTAHLLRGLLVHGLLLLCLKKRWNVQYGLHAKRDPVAVPFHAKGVPSEQAEWGHPDVAILLTCQAFYYQGLGQKQIQQSLQVVLKSNDPATEYDRWIQSSATLPDALRYWNIINVDDEGQIAEIWRHLRFSTVVVNHFLNHFVFPAHAKQFSFKLQASGWDIPLFTSASDRSQVVIKPGITTGFSGTNDNRHLLPLTIKQQDLPGLSHTNAEVLTYLLQPRNRNYILAANHYGKRLTETQLLEQLAWRKIRILIDAGAFILEMDNKSLVVEWLKKDHAAQAAVYFDSNNKAWVQYRNGKNVPLIATPFVDNLNECLVYLDEAHTRGTDLNLPPFAYGALTLGLNQTKDHTVQAAMRMRQLGTTQSITYFSPPEVHQSVQDVCKNHEHGHLDSSHIVTWLLDQTCTNIQELQALYFSQGRDFCHRMQAAIAYDQFLTDTEHRKAYLAVLQQPEQQLLEQLYTPEPSTPRSRSPMDSIPRLTGKLAEFEHLLRRREDAFQNLHGLLKSSAMDEVEQEREVAFQVEEERQIQRPRRMPAYSFPGLHSSLRDFITTGLLNDSSGYGKASEFIQLTQIGQKYGAPASRVLRHLYISDEFRRTVKVKNGGILDNFTRPVNWILWSFRSYSAMVIIPEEAELAIPMLRANKTSRVHLLLYAAPVVRKMLLFNSLTYHAIPSLPLGWVAPPWLVFEVGILAGRLYFDFSECGNVLECLRLAEPPDGINGCVSGRDTTSDSKAALAFLGEWLAVRRQGQDITHTPMGYLCQGWQLRQDHPFFITDTRKKLGAASGSPLQRQSHLCKDEEEGHFDIEIEDEGFVDGGASEDGE